MPQKAEVVMLSRERILISPWNMYITNRSSYLVFNFVFYSDAVSLFLSLRNTVLHIPSSSRALADF